MFHIRNLDFIYTEVKVALYNLKKINIIHYLRGNGNCGVNVDEKDIKKEEARHENKLLQKYTTIMLQQ